MANLPSNTNALEELVALMAKIGSCFSPSFSPDGSRIAFVSNLSGIPHVWIVDSAGGWPDRVTALDDPVGEVRWSPTGEWLAFSVAPGGGMNEQVYLIRPNGTGLRRLTDGGLENNWLGPWASDGRALAVTSNRRAPEAMDSYFVDPASGAFSLVVRNEGIGRLTDVSKDQHSALLYRMAYRGNSNLYHLDLQSGAEILLTPHEGPGAFTDAKFARDGRWIYFISDRDREMPALARAMFDGSGKPGEPEWVAARDDAELQEFALSDDGSTAALVWNASGKSELAFVRLADLQMSAGPVLPFEIIYNVSFSSNGSNLALVGSGSASPTDIWVYDRAAGLLRQLTHSAHTGIELQSLVQPRLVTFPAHDGLQLSAWLYEPHGAARPGPIVLSFHGGPEGQERPFFTATYQALLAQGIAVLAPNVRGSGGFGKTFVNLDNGPLRVNGVRDIQSCAAYVIDQGIADPQRIGIMGGSYGGYMTMAGLTEFPDLFAAGANLFGVVNFKTFFEQTEPWMAAISKVEYGDPDRDGQMLMDLSPIHKVDRVKAPTIVLHGANDTNVPVIEAEQVVNSLRERGVPVEYILFPDEGHGFRKEPNRIRSTVAIVNWFTKYLKSSG